ncbi:DUF3618 domain-containing protein [Rhizobium sp. XQZ8]|uniref:DUF3618 domain-containing protein n=1 Tax=Rhizobium populisoli TaxID=2859785 RepID=UPI001CA47B37|nr:DUF3618 domain-containing protein [Rhizobium populisoli]MBW6425408.1 DUF3618 domain-containing protein [Rhizobium populisoli]
MAHTSETTKSVEIEREIEADRRRIEEKIDAIQQRMSPGQIVDEALAYVKSSGGGEYVANLGNAFKNNPIPLALMGVSLAWLMAAPKTTVSSYADRQEDEVEYPLAVVSGDMRRAGPVQADGDKRYSHFIDGAGKRFKALTDETGRRAGHFMDESGQTFRGFADASGRQIHDIRDEAGKLLDQASGWASHTWRQITHSTGKIGDAVAGAGRSSLNAGTQLNETILRQFKDQPLVGGALAFAVGAAIGAALPHTRTEDEALGSAAADVRGRVSSEASKAMDKAGNLASEVYEKTTSVAADVHDVARKRIAEEATNLRSSDDQSSSSTRPH